MKSQKPKVLHEVCGMPMLGYLLDHVKSLGVRDIAVVAGSGRSQVEHYVASRAKIVEQKQRRGSGHALLQTKSRLTKFAGDTVMVLYGDTPLLKKETLKSLLESFAKQDADCALVTAKVADPTGYGRIVKNGTGNLFNIVEELSATSAEKAIQEINLGAYCFKKKLLFKALAEIQPDSKKGEYYLTDAVRLLAERGKVTCVQANSPHEALGVNSRRDLSQAERLMRQRVLEYWMDQGVTIKDPNSIYIDAQVTIGQDTVIYPNTVIEGPTTIGKGCQIGPFAHVRSGVHLKDQVVIGNFVEVTRSRVGEGALIKHLTYIGDAEIGSNANIGAGTITANFDGKKKHRTLIESGAQVGSGTVFVAPVKMRKGAKTGAGAVVVKNTEIPRGATVLGVPAKVLRKGKNK